MTSIFEITDWAHVASFFVWTLAVCAIAKVLFGSLPVAELQYRLSLRDAPRRQRMNRLNWEIHNRAKWDEAIARRPQHAAKQPLSDEEVEGRRIELQQLARSSLAWRAFTFFMGCFACQAFWTALAVYAITRGITEPAACFFTATGCAGAGVLLSTAGPIGQDRRPNGANQAVCKSCGK